VEGFAQERYEHRCCNLLQWTEANCVEPSGW